MRGQWIDYTSFNLTDLIDEVKTRVDEPYRADDILHGAMIAGKDYYGTCNEIKKFLIRDDTKDCKTKPSQILINVDGITYIYPDGKKEKLEEILHRYGITI